MAMASKYDGLWGRQIREQAEYERRIKSMIPTERPWRWLPDEGQFIVAKGDRIVAEIPCQGCNPADGALIVEAVNKYDDYRGALERIAKGPHSTLCAYVKHADPCNCHVAIAQKAVEGK
jgi:hypothetical protein